MTHDPDNTEPDFATLEDFLALFDDEVAAQIRRDITATDAAYVALLTSANGESDRGTVH